MRTISASPASELDGGILKQSKVIQSIVVDKKDKKDKKGRK